MPIGVARVALAFAPGVGSLENEFDFYGALDRFLAQHLGKG